MSEHHYIGDFGEERVMIRTGDGKFVSKPKAVVELEEENARLKEENKKLYLLTNNLLDDVVRLKELLYKAIDHLDYCGYGDAYERDGSRDLQKELDQWKEQESGEVGE